MRGSERRQGTANAPCAEASDGGLPPAGSQNFSVPDPVDADVLALYERMYIFELERREDLTNRLQLQLALVAAMMTTLGWAGTHMHEVSPGVVRVVLYTILASGGMFALPALFWFLRAVLGSTYECIPEARVLEAHRRQLLGTYAQWSEGAEWSKRLLQQRMLDYYADCAGRNAIVNENRYTSIYKSLEWTVAAGTLGGVAALTQWIAFASTAPAQ
jgi:hypothetical protein